MCETNTAISSSKSLKVKSSIRSLREPFPPPEENQISTFTCDADVASSESSVNFRWTVNRGNNIDGVESEDRRVQVPKSSNCYTTVKSDYRYNVTIRDSSNTTITCTIFSESRSHTFSIPAIDMSLEPKDGFKIGGRMNITCSLTTDNLLTFMLMRDSTVVVEIQYQKTAQGYVITKKEMGFDCNLPSDNNVVKCWKNGLQCNDVAWYKCETNTAISTPKSLKDSTQCCGTAILYIYIYIYIYICCARFFM
ncbi:Hypothetical predicted protein [Octopus vulgaris]|uniref:Ig-like domain-containing protein n=1 Tax=Octopus vulgaris TaxID=6645 RepID=A0AA36BPX7_OCTVU|nr:Hypothetical predicted protein [Octopus vulgaris]